MKHSTWGTEGCKTGCALLLDWCSAGCKKTSVQHIIIACALHILYSCTNIAAKKEKRKSITLSDVI